MIFPDTLTHMKLASPICFRWFMHFMADAFDLARPSVGKSIPARIAMIAITTRSSIRVNARRPPRLGEARCGTDPGILPGRRDAQTLD